MRQFETVFGGAVDLDDPKTYAHLPDDIRKLDDMMFLKIGFALVYMDYFHPDIYVENQDDDSIIARDGRQRLRVNILIKNFAENRKDNWENLLWFKEQYFIFEEEVENMC